MSLAIHDMNDCGAACRGEVKTAVHECRVWLGNRDDATRTSACVDALSSMRTTCERHVAAADADDEDDEGGDDDESETTAEKTCAAPSNVLSYFAAHGVHDPRRRKNFRRIDLHKHEVVAARIAAAIENEELELAHEAKRRRAAAAAAATAASAAASAATTISGSIAGNETSVAEGTSAASRREALLGFAESREIDGLPFKDALAAAAAGVQPAASMFPTCSVHHGCSLRCRHRLRDVLDRCMRFANEPSARRSGSEHATGCEDAVRASDDACNVASGDRAACAEPLTSGFRAMLASRTNKQNTRDDGKP